MYQIYLAYNIYFLYYPIIIPSVFNNASFSINFISHSYLLHSRCEAYMDSTLGNVGVIKEKL